MCVLNVNAVKLCGSICIGDTLTSIPRGKLGWDSIQTLPASTQIGSGGKTPIFVKSCSTLASISSDLLSPSLVECYKIQVRVQYTPQE